MREINETSMRMVNGGDNIQQVSIGTNLVAGNFVLVQKQKVYTKINVKVISIKRFW